MFDVTKRGPGSDQPQSQRIAVPTNRKLRSIRGSRRSESLDRRGTWLTDAAENAKGRGGRGRGGRILQRFGFTATQLFVPSNAAKSRPAAFQSVPVYQAPRFTRLPAKAAGPVRWLAGRLGLPRRTKKARDQSLATGFFSISLRPSVPPTSCRQAGRLNVLKVNRAHKEFVSPTPLPHQKPRFRL